MYSILQKYQEILHKLALQNLAYESTMSASIRAIVLWKCLAGHFHTRIQNAQFYRVLFGGQYTVQMPSKAGINFFHLKMKD
jgi:hypothetical protein